MRTAAHDERTGTPNRAGLRRRFALALIACSFIALSLAPAANATDRVYWSNLFGNTISYANLDGSGGGDLPINPATLDGPMGLAVDTAAGKVYWSNYGFAMGAAGTTIGVANLDGSDAQILPIAAGLVSGPHGVAVDAAANKLYWTNRDEGSGNSWIGVSNLDGSGASMLNTGAADMEGPRGLAIDKAAGRIYWANFFGNMVSYASLAGGQGADLNTGSATVNNPEGVALDGSGRLFYSNFNSVDRISYLNLDGSGGADLDTSPLTPDEPHGVAIDAAAGRIYWPNFTGNTITFANLGGGGGGTVPTGAATVNGPNLPILFEAPSVDGLAKVSGGSAPGSKLNCKSSFDPDLLTALLYRAPQSRAYKWLMNGHEVPGETSPDLTVHSVADYSCLVTGQNTAGSATQGSEVDAIFKVGHLRRNLRKGTAKLTVKIPGPGALAAAGKKIVKQRAAGHGSGSFARKVKGSPAKLLIKPKGKAKRRLSRTGKVKVRVRVSYKQAGAEAGSQTKVVRLKQK